MKRIRNVLSIVLICTMLISSVVIADINLNLLPGLELKEKETIKLPGLDFKETDTKIIPGLEPKEFKLEQKEEKPPLKFDGTESDWAEAEVLEAYKYGLTYDEVEKDFQKQITREEFATISVKLYEKLSGKTATPATNPFTDTKNPEILKAYKIGIVKGTSDTTFSPNNSISRQEICVMIKRALKESYPNLKLSFSGEFPFKDADKIADWAIESVKYAYQHEIMKGTSGDTISPLNNTTKEQGIILLKRTYEKGSSNGLPMVIDKSSIELVDKNKVFPVKTEGAKGASKELELAKGLSKTGLGNLQLGVDIKDLIEKVEIIKPGEAAGFPLTSKDANLRGLGFLGKGVNVITDKYADDIGQYYILDSKKLLNDGRIYMQENDNSSSRFVSGQDAWTYSESLAVSVNVSGKYLCFGGSVKTKFNSQHLKEKNRSFATLMYRASKYDLFIDDVSINLRDYLSDSFKKDIETLDAKSLFERYGTHVLRSIIMGGRIEYDITTDSSYQSSSSNLEVDVKASFNAVFASANIGVNVNQSEASTSFKEHSEINIQALPTYGSAVLDPKNFDKWYDAMLQNPGICDYGDNPLIPIWDLVSDFNRKLVLQAAYKEYAESKNFIPAQVTYGINGIRIQRGAINQYFPPKYIDPKTKDEWELVGNLRVTYKKSPRIEKAMLYVRKGFSNDTSKPPIVDLIFAYHKEGSSNPWEKFDMVYGGDSDAKLWGALPKNMESDSGLEYYVNSVISIHYVTSRNHPQLTDLRIRSECYDNLEDISYYPANTEDDPNFLPFIDVSKNERFNITLGEAYDWDKIYLEYKN